MTITKTIKICPARVLVALAAAAAVGACGPSAPPGGVDDDRAPPVHAETPPPPQALDSEPVRPERPVLPDPEPPAQYPLGCARLFDPAEVQVFEVEIEPAHWAAMQDEYFNHAERKKAGLPSENYYPVKRLKHGDRQTTSAQIRLRGNPTYWFKQDKFQFQLSFDETDKKGRFRGLRKIVLDAAHYNTSLMRDRLATSVYHDLGLPSSCVNHARLYINGQYYGAYQNIEKVDKEFLERNFVDPEHNLYKKGKVLKTNRSHDPDTSVTHRWWAATTVAALEEVMDVEQFVTMLAAEAVFPNADGYWSGGWNFYLYDHPQRGLLYLPWDVDLAFDNLPADTHPLTWRKTSDNFNGRPHVELVLADPKWRRVFVEKVGEIRAASPPEVLQARIDAWAAQIEPLVDQDPNKPFTLAQHRAAVQRLRNHVQQRAVYLDGWLHCARQDPDAACP
jgi:hypothetical protein